MARTRREVRSLGETWNPTVLWYAKAVAALSKRPATDKTSWRYLAAMHNFNKKQWIDYGYLTAAEPLPKTDEQKKYWQQCQHQSWYFWPWHRAYLHTFEDILLDWIKSQKEGPADWALPYWNYSNQADPNATKVPDAFLAQKLPDGSNNPLYVRYRYGRAVNPADVDLTDRIAENNFAGTDQGPSLGVGGPDTGFSLAGSQEGLVEALPHDAVHGEVGGRNGLMSYTSSAGLDPIFWVHHANIDRIWEVWLHRDPANKNPKIAAWLKGPSRPRSFALYGPDGKDRPSDPKDVLSTTALGYDYDDISDPLQGADRRMVRLTALRPNANALATLADKAKVRKMTRKPPKAELLGSNDKEIALGPNPVRSRIKLANRPLATLSKSFTKSLMSTDTPSEPDRVFLHLEKIRGKDGSGIFDVVLHKSDAPPGSPGVKAGAISLFGLEEASKRDGRHGGNGLNKTIEITKAIDAMKLDPTEAKNLDVEIVPRSDVRKEDAIKVGQITVHRMAGK
jgi:tyrosinase